MPPRSPATDQDRALARSLAPRLGHEFRKPHLLRRALTHPSWSNESAAAGAGEPPGHYESLEFLGDAVLGLLVAELIFRRFPAWSEGEMSRLRAALVNTNALAARAGGLGLGPEILMGRGERASGGETKRSILADAYESVLGAIFLDGGVRAARAFVRREFGASVREAQPTRPQAGDFKTRLQESVQALSGELPVYRLVEVTGPAHKRSFTVEVALPDGRTFRSTGTSKKQAEQASAEAAMSALAVRDPRNVDPRGAGG